MKRIIGLASIALALTTGCTEYEGELVGPRGGVVMSDDGRFVLEIPKGALEDSIEITIDEVECERPESVGPCYELGPVGLPLLRPGTITYELEPEMLDGVDIAELGLQAERDDGWSRLADREVDPKGEVVSGSAVYLSAFAIVRQ
ncbi:MAG: hypothetical protein AAF799_29680 [Myxococcota bacterium]